MAYDSADALAPFADRMEQKMKIKKNASKNCYTGCLKLALAASGIPWRVEQSNFVLQNFIAGADFFSLLGIPDLFGKVWLKYFETPCSNRIRI